MRAFTLVELLVVVLIFSLIMFGIFGILHVANVSWDTTSGMLELVQGVRQAMDGMARESRQTSADQITVNDGGARLDFYIPNIAPAISYYLQNNQLIREYPPGTTKVLANNISQITFTANTSTLQIQINAAQTTARKVPLSFSSTELVKFRN
jgi:prepilin-type N-terminal cleavage/methylation domain-containing protein